MLGFQYVYSNLVVKYHFEMDTFVENIFYGNLFGFLESGLLGGDYNVNRYRYIDLPVHYRKSPSC